LIEHGKIGEIYNVAGGFEQQNIETVKAIISEFGQIKNWEDFHDIDHYVDFSCNRKGQDVRYALDDSKLRNLKWESKSLFSEEIIRIVSYYKNKFIW
jgi:dTDP-glucose 4,6-dehydratase